MNPLEKLYRDSIEYIISAIGLEAAFNALMKEAKERIDFTLTQGLSKEGAFASEAANIVGEYADWRIGFNYDDKNGVGAKILAPHASSVEGRDLEAEAREIQGRIRVAFEKYNKPKIPGVGVSLEMRKVKAEPEEWISGCLGGRPC